MFYNANMHNKYSKYNKKRHFQQIMTSVQKFKTCQKVSYAHQGCIYLVKNIVKTVLQLKISVFYLSIFSFVIYSCNEKAEFSASLLQSSVLHDPSEIILIC